MTQAGTTAKVAVAEQIVELLGPKTYLSPMLGDDGKPTGEFETLVKFNDVDEDGKPTVVNLTPDATLKRMRELDSRFSNLFLNPGSGGMGGNSGSGAGKGAKQTVEALKDTETFMKWRKENPGADPTKYKG